MERDAERLDPAVRVIVDRGGFYRADTSTSQLDRFEAAWPSSEANLATYLSGAGIDRVHEPQAADDDRARHGQPRERDARRAGRLRLQRSLRA
jgi:hypothetical protein